MQAILQTQPDTVSLDSPADTADTIMEVHHPAVPSVLLFLVMTSFILDLRNSSARYLPLNRTEEYLFSELSFKEPNPDYLVSFIAIAAHLV